MFLFTYLFYHKHVLQFPDTFHMKDRIHFIIKSMILFRLSQQEKYALMQNVSKKTENLGSNGGSETRQS